MLITHPGCPACAEVKKRIKSLLDQGKVRELDLSTSQEANRIADALDIRYIPTFVARFGNKICRLDENMKPDKCVEIKR